jgi:5'(3')-deoxyribonucleotidase
MRIALDFDGVICKRNKVPREPSFADSKPNKFARKVILQLMDRHELYICTNRDESEFDDIRAWLDKYKIPKLLITNKKLPKTGVYLDDRALRFTNWLDISKYFV